MVLVTLHTPWDQARGEPVQEVRSKILEPGLGETKEPRESQG